ncbi:hypothetical protein AVEN_124530-1 [Araneus ventricosus]|uniref:Uncharacterized protein n=1 Tax=Araneus ventricosus TaxID=182803 RepID=A0A4Y2TVJ1_ARAVE|nr:hypothetical protein AVEN_47906-1 [Araneus ventricosus]GBO03450.1 hypothetical protein AVEN_124530-1 [Araneus ventricosus]
MTAVSILGSEELEVLAPSCIEIVQESVSPIEFNEDDDGSLQAVVRSRGRLTTSKSEELHLKVKSCI